MRRGSGIDRVLDQFFHHGRRTLDNFAGGDLVGDVLGKYVDSSHVLAIGTATRNLTIGARLQLQFTRAR